MVRYSSVSLTQEIAIARLEAGDQAPISHRPRQNRCSSSKLSRRPLQQDDPTQFLVGQQQFAVSVQWLFALDSSML